MRNESKFAVMGLLAGAAIGAALGILLAPKSGRSTRKDISRQARKAKREMMEQYEKMRGKTGNRAADMIEDAGDRVSARADRAAQTVRERSN